MHPQPVIFLMGPTAAGKTACALALAQALPVDVVSVDSAMVYQGMDIGTAKPDAATRARVPHRLIDIRDPAQAYTAAEFARDAADEIRAIHASGRIPLLVGGTGLYFRALERGLTPLPSADPKLRAQLQAQADHLGWPALHRRLAVADPGSAARIHPNDSQRIQRALEILALTGAPPSEHYARAGAVRAGATNWPTIKLALTIEDRQQLGRRIADRFERMLADGFLAEVEKLHARPDLNLHTPAMRAVGYQQLWRYLDQQWDWPYTVSRALIATRQLAKRQLTWLRRETGMRWFTGNQELVASQMLSCLENALLR